MKKAWVRDILFFLGIFAFFFLMFRVVFFNGHVPSGSMEPTIHTDDFIFGNRLAYKFKEPKRGDIIIFNHATDYNSSKMRLIKRVIGLPGDTVIITDGHVYINGELYDESKYLSDSVTTYAYYNDDPNDPTHDYREYVVPQGHYFVLGDNRENSRDSRLWYEPYVPKSEIESKYLFHYKSKFLNWLRSFFAKD